MIRLNVENLIRDIRSQSDKDFSGHITDSQLTQMIERSWSSLYQEIIQNNETFYVKKTAVNIRAKDNYLPNDFLKLIGVDRYRDDKFISLDKGNFQNRQDFQYTNFDESPYGYDTDYRYTYFGNTISINSKLRDVNTNFVIYYIPEAPSVVSGNAFVQKGWEQWIIFDVAIKAKMREESEIRGLILQRGEILERIKVFADSRDFGSPPTINRVADYSDEGYDSFYPYSQDVDSTLTFDDLLVPNFNEKIPYPVEFLETYTAKAIYYEFLEAENTAYIGFLNEEDESQWCVARIQNKRINYGIFSENTDHNSLEGAWADRLNLTYIQSITVVTEEETVSVTPGSAEEGQMQAPHVLFGWSQDNITDVTNVDSASFVRFNSPYGSNITIPASGLSQAYFLVGVSNEGRFDQFSIGGLDQVGIFLELGVENGYRYYISENPLLPEFFGNRTVTLGISGQAQTTGTIAPSPSSAPTLGTINLKLLWSDTDGYPDIEGDSRVNSYTADAGSKTISGDFHDANSGLKVYRGNNNFWVKDEEIANNGDISSVLSEFDDSGLRTVRPALTIAGKITDIDAKASELLLLQPPVGTKTDRYSRYAIPQNGLPTLASETNDANSGTLSRVVGGDEDVLVCREEAVSNGVRESSKDFGLSRSDSAVRDALYVWQIRSNKDNYIRRVLLSNNSYIESSEFSPNLFGLAKVNNNLIYLSNDHIGVVDPNTLAEDTSRRVSLSSFSSPHRLGWPEEIASDGVDVVWSNPSTGDRAYFKVWSYSENGVFTRKSSSDFTYNYEGTGGSYQTYSCFFIRTGVLCIISSGFSNNPPFIRVFVRGSDGTYTRNSNLEFNLGITLTGSQLIYSSLFFDNSIYLQVASPSSNGSFTAVSAKALALGINPGNLARFYSYNQSDNARASSLDFDFSKNAGESVKSMFYTGQYLNIVLSDGTNSRTVVYKREASSYVRQSSLDKAFTGVNFDNASFDNKKLFNVSSIVDDMSGGGTDASNTVLYALDNNSDSLYTINKTTAAPTLVGTAGALGSGGWWSLTWDGSNLYAIEFISNELYTINITTGAKTRVGNGLGFGNWRCLASDGISLYTIKDEENSLYRINKTTGVPTYVGTEVSVPLGNLGVSDSWQGLTYDGTNLFAVGIDHQTLYLIDKNTGRANIVGSQGSLGTDEEWNSLAWDGANLYSTNRDNDSLYTINKVTGIATLVGVIDTSGAWRSLTAVTTQGGA